MKPALPSYSASVISQLATVVALPSKPKTVCVYTFVFIKNAPMTAVNRK